MKIKQKSSPQRFQVHYFEYLIPPILFLNVYFHYSIVSWVESEIFSPTIIYYCLTPYCLFPIIGLYLLASLVASITKHKRVKLKLIIVGMSFLVAVLSGIYFDSIALFKERSYFFEHEEIFHAVAEDISQTDCFQTDAICPLEFELTGEASDVMSYGSVVVQKIPSHAISINFAGRANLFYIYVLGYDTPPVNLRVAQIAIDCIESLSRNWFLCHGYSTN